MTVSVNDLEGVAEVCSEMMYLYWITSRGHYRFHNELLDSTL